VSERKAELIPGSYHSSWGRNPLTAPGAGSGSSTLSKIQADLAPAAGI
jgi:hypothetical protein